MTIATIINRYQVTIVGDLLDQIEDEKIEAVDDAVIPPRDELVSAKTLDDILEELPGRYQWEYTHDPYEDIEATITELPMQAWENGAGVSHSELPNE